MSLPILTNLQALNDRGIPFPVPSEAEMFALADPGCRPIFQFLNVDDPMFSEYLYFMDLQGLNTWSLVGELINKSRKMPEALSHRSIQQKVMIYLNNYDLVKTWPDFDLQQWIDHNPKRRIRRFDRLFLRKNEEGEVVAGRDDNQHWNYSRSELIIEGDQVWVEFELYPEHFSYLLNHYSSPVVLKKAWAYVEPQDEKFETFFPTIDYTDLARVKLMYHILEPSPQEVVVATLYPTLYPTLDHELEIAMLLEEPDGEGLKMAKKAKKERDYIGSYQPVLDFLLEAGFQPTIRLYEGTIRSTEKVTGWEDVYRSVKVTTDEEIFSLQPKSKLPSYFPLKWPFP